MNEELKKKVIEIIDRHCRYCDPDGGLHQHRCIGDKEDQVEELLSFINQEKKAYFDEQRKLIYEEVEKMQSVLLVDAELYKNKDRKDCLIARARTLNDVLSFLQKESEEEKND